MTDDLRTHVQDLLAPEYQVGRELGRGGMAVVYSASDRRLGRNVAIKVLPPELAFRAGARERFVREARIAAALDHPGIVRVYAAAVRDDIAYFAMALVEGESLATRMARVGPFSFADAQLLLADVADALAYAHHAGVVHRDIKPANLLIDAASGRSLVSDFGIARPLGHDVRLSQEGDVIGTPAYMAPEQATDDADIDLRPDTPRHLVAAIEGALAKNPAARGSAAAFRAALGGAPAVEASAVEESAVHASRPLERPVTPENAQATVEAARRVKAFRAKTLQAVTVASLLAVLNLKSGPSLLVFLGIAALLALDLLISRSAPPGHDLTMRYLLTGAIPDGTTEAAPVAPTAPALPADSLVESLWRDAERHHMEIHRLIDALSDDERAILPNVAAPVDALHQHIRSLVTGLRELGTHPDARSRVLEARLENAVDALHEVWAELTTLRDARFERSIDELDQLLQDPMT